MSLLGSRWIGDARRALSSLVLALLNCAALVLAVGGLYCAIDFACRDLMNLVAPAAVLSAAGLATLGWLTTASNQRMLSRKQHTLNLLIQWRHSDLYRTNLEAVTRLSPKGAALTPRQLDLLTGKSIAVTTQDSEFVTGATYILNYWEFVCAAVLVGDLDAELIRRTVRPHIVGTYKKFAPKIELDQKANSQTFVHLRRLSDRWPS